ncbi:hypothetical protein HAL013_01010 [Helicobacter ailurogastricus]|uniref:Uncharacterized protein n=1 Tax=Helicobacter ailurogastricus TaxID=1578720 RepID=A0A0K2X631_9HELI|nr:hypothetical protein HAL011_02890 [Helicobacter ailurogastricus]CRF41952.1 hypothetical protein HAL013_01010 [Helicobacter ailurogastricus]CRF44739.1 hypothetical protein HAL09_13490 [Helicobacter ailurogastricus]
MIDRHQKPQTPCRFGPPFYNPNYDRMADCCHLGLKTH